MKYDELFFFFLNSLCEICFSQFLIRHAYILLYKRSATSSLVGGTGFESEFPMIFGTSL